jgi:membrane-bound lytic murein transglycosylase D
MKTLVTAFISFSLLVMICAPYRTAAQTASDDMNASDSRVAPAPATPPSAVNDDYEEDNTGDTEALDADLPSTVTEDQERPSPLATPADPQEFDIPVVFNEAVDKYLHFFSVTKHELFGRWLKRTRRYAPVVREILRKHGLPEDLVYLAMVESGFNLRAYSRAKACGPWQFINETGQRYGLKVNYWVDERRDLEKSTIAAARYLKDLFDQFGCWQLAAAGYNAGEHRIEKAIEKHDTSDFWKLRAYNALPKETREYVPQIFAAAIIAKDPERFGFTDLDAPSYDPPKIRVPGGLSLKGIARAGALPLTELKSLNPEMLKGITPPNRKEYVLKLPEDTDPTDVSKKLQVSLSDSRRIVGVIQHSVKKKDSLPRILRKYGIDSADLALLNDQGETPRIRRGQVLLIPRFASLTRGSLSVTPVEGPDDDVTDLSSLTEPKEKGIFVADDGDDDVVTLRKPTRSIRRAGATRTSDKQGVHAANRNMKGDKKTDLRVTANNRTDGTSGKGRLARLSVKKPNHKTRASSAGKRKSLARTGHPRPTRSRG